MRYIFQPEHREKYHLEKEPKIGRLEELNQTIY